MSSFDQRSARLVFDEKFINTWAAAVLFGRPGAPNRYGVRPADMLSPTCVGTVRYGCSARDGTVEIAHTSHTTPINDRPVM